MPLASLALLAAATAVPDPASDLGWSLHGPPRPDGSLVAWDGPPANGRPVGGLLRIPADRLGGGALPSPLLSPPTPFETIHGGGDPLNRLDLVLLGDGFQADELDGWAEAAQTFLDEFLLTEPYRTYAAYVNVHRGDVVSIDSGVDNDPVPGVLRDTAMDMRFWCEGVERLLCVNVDKADYFANQAPAADQVMAVANSSKYGGAGYFDENIATWPAFVPISGPYLAIHEFGHSFGSLADEYFNSSLVYGGPEVPFANASIYRAQEMEDLERKWYRWLGHDDPTGGPVDTFVGAAGYGVGLHRPTATSGMRQIGTPFNAPSVEKLILEIHRHVDPIDAWTPEGVVAEDAVLQITPMQPVGHDLTVTWLLDGEPLDVGGATTLDLATLDLPAGERELRVVVVDETDLVRNELIRDIYMTGERTWTVLASGSGCDADVDGDGVVGIADFTIVIASWGPCPPGAPCLADLDGDGVVGLGDLLAIFGAWGGC